MKKRVLLLAPTLALLASTLALPAPPLPAQEDAVMRALKEELQRSMQKLQLEGLEKPYFIAYRVQERQGSRLEATFGSLVARGQTKGRLLSVEVRVGSPVLDNSNFFSFPGGAGVSRRAGAITPLPLDDDYAELRRQVWLATDGAYKKALEDLSKKRAALQNRNRPTEIPDFAQAAVNTFKSDRSPVGMDLSGAEALLREVSATFREMPGIFASTASLEASQILDRYLNSEGTTFIRHTSSVGFNAGAATQAPDGMPLEDSVVFYGRSLSDLPSRAELLASVRELGTRLGKAREAPLLDRYTGPVLFEGQAAGELLAQILAPRLAAQPATISDLSMGPSFGADDNPLLDKLGARVLPDSMSLVDDPTATTHQGALLVGGYPVDDDGLPARLTPLVEKGILKTLLTTRSPVRGIAESNAHRRGGSAAPSNLLLSAEGGLSAPALRQQLLDRAKQRGNDFAVVVRRIRNPLFRVARDSSLSFGPPDRDAARLDGLTAVYKVFPDGREELVRCPELRGMTLPTLKEIVAVSRERTVYSAPFVSRSLSFTSLPGESLVSYVVPALAFEDLTLQKPSREVPKPPIMPHPFFEKKGP